MTRAENPYLRRTEFTEDAPDRDRWLVSYADFITLLMAFFVVMYSVSSVNTGKFRVLSNSMVTVFNEKTSPEAARAAPIDLGGGVMPQGDIAIAPQNVAMMEEAASSMQGAAAAPVEILPAPRLGTPEQRLETALGPLMKRDDVRIRDSRDWLEIELASELLFASGSAELQARALPALREIAGVIADLGKPVRIEGHTDNVPLNGGRFASNWHLSAARAATIAEQLGAAGVAPERLSAVGYGEYRPLADNATDAGRLKNRRVVIGMAKHVGLLDGVTENPGTQAARVLRRIETLPPQAEIGP